MFKSSISNLEHVAGLVVGLLDALTWPSEEDEDESKPLAPPSAVTDTPQELLNIYNLSLQERSISNASRRSATIRADPVNPPQNDGHSMIVQWLQLLRHTLSIRVQDKRADLTLSHDFDGSLAPLLGVGATFVVRRWVRGSRGSDLAVKFARRCSHDEEAALLKAVGVEIQALMHPDIRKNEYIVRLVAVDWQYMEGASFPWPVLLTQCADFGDLASFQNRKLMLRFDTKINLCLDVALGIRALHANGFVHGDVKSENVLLFRRSSRGMIAKLSDFAFSIAAAARSEKYLLPGMTFPYNAPEFDFGGNKTPLDFKGLRLSDVYSVGMLVWRTMLNGQNPFDWWTLSFPGIERSSARVLAISIQKRSAIVIDQACGTIELCSREVSKDIQPDRVRSILEATLQVNPARRDLKATIFALAEGCGRTESIANFHDLNRQYRHPDPREVDGHLDTTGKNDDQILTALERNPRIDMPVFLSFHPVDKGHSAVQRHILLALQDLAKGNSDRSNTVKIMLFFIHLCGFGHAFLQDLQSVVPLKYLEDAAEGFLENIMEDGIAESQLFGEWLKIRGGSFEVLPIKHATTFAIQVLHALAKNQNGFKPGRYEAGLAANAAEGSPIAMELLRRRRVADSYDGLHARDAFGLCIGSTDRMDEKHKRVLFIPRDNSPSWESVIAANADISWDLHFGTISGLGWVARNGDTYLHIAAKHGYTGVIRRLVNLLPGTGIVNLRNWREESPLLRATMAGHLGVCEVLLAAGADVKESLYRETPLHWVSVFTEPGDIEFLARAFIDRGASLTAVAGRLSHGTMDTHSDYGTPLERAVRRNNSVAVKILLEVADDPKALVSDEALHTAAAYHFSHCLKHLLEANPKINSKKNIHNLIGSAILGAPLWQWMNWHGAEYEQAGCDTLQVLLDFKVATKWVATYVPFSQVYLNRLSAVGAAAVVGTAHMIHMLAKRGLPVEAQLDPTRYENESPPLYEAMSRGYYEASKALLQHGADPNLTRMMLGGYQYLHLCAFYHWDIAFTKLLLEHGAEVDILDGRGRTPFYTAILAENFEFADLLLANGADKTGGPPQTTNDPEDVSLFGYMLRLAPQVSTRQLEYVIRLKDRHQDSFMVCAQLGVTALHQVCLVEVGYAGRMREYYSSIDDRRIIEFVLKTFPGSHNINARTADGEWALSLAVKSCHFEAVHLLLGTGMIPQPDRVRCFKLAVFILSAQFPDDVFAAGEKSEKKFRDDAFNMAMILRNSLPPDPQLYISLNCFSHRYDAIRDRDGVNNLPLRRRWIVARRYCSGITPAEAAAGTNILMPRYAPMFNDYLEDLTFDLAAVLPNLWFLASYPTAGHATTSMIPRIAKVLWNSLDVDWVAFVYDGVHGTYESPSQRLNMLQNALQDLLGPGFSIQLKFAGAEWKLELLFRITLAARDKSDEEYERSQVVYFPTFEEGRTWEEVHKHEELVKCLRIKQDMNRRQSMLRRLYGEEVWQREKARAQRLDW